MVEILKELFNGNPEESKIELNDICSDCKSDVTIKITHTTRGFGLQGGALFKSSAGGYYAKCPDCYNLDRAKADDTPSPSLSRVRSRRLRYHP
jgi:hypothetical protein